MATGSAPGWAPGLVDQRDALVVAHCLFERVTLNKLNCISQLDSVDHLH